ncbi:hypothetical protein D9619_001170 [Psilocybe cf. subviscida]|uniref:Uncharacterized protein n=1 Tax=Psilocybe cf. subviscida TaxID=2480587 RepID=A0A8H5BC97_9AGAR|nr:hypothetical protein D9619_001170 [Psilocybe cf. subviscida]
MATRQEIRQRFLNVYPLVVQFDDPEPMHLYGTIPKEGRASGIRVPWYCAGFFVHPTWLGPWAEKHNIRSWWDIGSAIRSLPGGEVLDKSLRVEPYFDKDHCAFLCLHDNFEDNCGVTMGDWLARRDKQFDVLCKVLQLDDEVTEMMKKNFAWHLFKPQMYRRVPTAITLHDPLTVDRFNSYL